jgi:hypothetical protein
MTRAQRALSREAGRAQRRRLARFQRAQLRREYGADFDLFRAEEACPCGTCGHGDQEAPGWLSKLPPAVLAVHEAHTARVLMLWELRHWRPEAVALLRRVITAAESVWLRVQLAADVARPADQAQPARNDLTRWLGVCLLGPCWPDLWPVPGGSPMPP